MPVTVKPIFYYLPLLEGGPQDQVGTLSEKMHLVKFGQKYTGGTGQFDARVVVYSHGSREKKTIMIGKDRRADGATFYQTHFLTGLFDNGNVAAFAALKKVELAVCHSGKDAPAFLDSFSQQLPEGVVTRGPTDALMWMAVSFTVGKKGTNRPISKQSSSGIKDYFLKGHIGGLDGFFRSVGGPGA
jgi:hypothetical protein